MTFVLPCDFDFTYIGALKKSISNWDTSQISYVSLYRKSKPPGSPRPFSHIKSIKNIINNNNNNNNNNIYSDIAMTRILFHITGILEGDELS